MTAKDIKNVACVGGGIIGYSWALGFAMKGMNVKVYDITEEALTLAKNRVHESLKLFTRNHILSEDETKEIEERISYTTSMEEAVKDALFIQESGPEHYDVKHQMVLEIEKYTSPETIIASSTSGLLITEIAKVAKYPERFVGAHPYNPPHLIPLVEITKGEKTTEENVNIAKEFFQLMGKEPVVLQKEALGFICNRLQMALYREVCELVMRGVCTVEDADKAVTFGPGLRWGIMGPSMIFQLGGGQVGIDGLFHHLEESITMWLNDMADFKEFPKKWPEIARKGVDEAIKNRPEELGNNDTKLAEYRDDMLVQLLKLHHKI